MLLMPKKIKDDDEFTKANIKVGTKEVLKRILIDERKYEYELLDELLREKFPNYFKTKQEVMI